MFIDIFKNWNFQEKLSFYFEGEEQFFDLFLAYLKSARTITGSFWIVGETPGCISLNLSHPEQIYPFLQFDF